MYPAPGKIDWLAPLFLLSIVGTLAMSVGLFLLRRRWPGLLAAWLSYLVILAPNSGDHPDQRPDRRGSVQLPGHAGLGDRGGGLFLPALADVIAGAHRCHRG